MFSPITLAASSSADRDGVANWGGPRGIEALGRIGGPEAAALIERIYARDAEEARAKFNHLLPACRARRGEQKSRQFLGRVVRNPRTSCATRRARTLKLRSLEPGRRRPEYRSRRAAARTTRSARCRYWSRTDQPAAGRRHPRLVQLAEDIITPSAKTTRTSPPRRQDLCRPGARKRPAASSRTGRPGSVCVPGAVRASREASCTIATGLRLRWSWGI